MGTTSTTWASTTTTTTTTTTRAAAPPRTTTYPRPSLKATTPRSSTRSTSASTTIFFLQPSPRSLQLAPMHQEEEEEEEVEQMTESSTVDIDLLYSGQYHEVNPGQYHEVHPGQYQEEVFRKASIHQVSKQGSVPQPRGQLQRRVRGEQREGGLCPPGQPQDVHRGGKGWRFHHWGGGQD